MSGLVFTWSITVGWLGLRAHQSDSVYVRTIYTHILGTSLHTDIQSQPRFTQYRGGGIPILEGGRELHQY